MQVQLSPVDMKRATRKDIQAYHKAGSWKPIGDDYQLAADVYPTSEDLCQVCDRTNRSLIGGVKVRGNPTLSSDFFGLATKMEDSLAFMLSVERGE